MPDPSTREQIRAEAIERLARVYHHGNLRSEMCQEAARQLVTPFVDALGDLLRPPVRVIQTPEELDALPVGTIVLDFFAAGCTRVHPDPVVGWVRATSALPSDRFGHHQHPPYLPAIVLHEPEEAGQ